MDISHVMVGVLTAAAAVFLVWAELRSRRNAAAQQSTPAPSLPEEVQPTGGNKKRER